MDVIWELMPNQTDTPEERAELVRQAQEYAKSVAQEDDFVCECPDDEKDEDVLKESDSDFTIDGKHKHFKYISSLDRRGDFISFGQDELGLWWFFTRTSLESGKDLHGPYRTRDKLHEALWRS